MWSRCTNPKAQQYRWYGGRGIKVCARWRSFAKFLADMGERPDGATLDRRNNNGNYTARNCRWASNVTQKNNTSANRVLRVRGKRMNIGAAEKAFGVDARTIQARIDRLGWSETEAATTPTHRTRSRVLVVRGRRVRLADAARALGCAPEVIAMRIDRLGWGDTKAATKQVRQLRSQAPYLR